MTSQHLKISSTRSLVRIFLPALAIMTVAAVLSIAGCGSSSDLGSDDAASGIGGIQTGGTLVVGDQPPSTFDPHFANLSAEMLINANIYDHLVLPDTQHEPTPVLATAWEMSEDGKTWTFTIRDGVKFNDGSPLALDDIVYTFDRLRDEEIGAPTAAVYANIDTISASGDNHVVFQLKEPDQEFVKTTMDFHACIIKEGADPAKDYIGTGAFMVEKYVPEERMELVKNPYYWGKDEEGNQLPYLDGLEFVFSPDSASLVQGLVGGQYDFVLNLSGEQADQVKASPNLELLVRGANFYVGVKMRSDGDRAAADPNVRLALRLGTDSQGLIDMVRPGYGSVGNGTIVGASYGDYYWDQPPEYNPGKAKQLLAEAGYGDGLDIDLYATQLGDSQALATAWREQMKQIGVNVNIKSVPVDVYYGDSGDASWMQCDWGVTMWGDRATPVMYFDVALTSDAVWNETHWSDAEFDQITKQISSELDTATRIELYHKAQQILWERGPYVLFCHESAIAGVSKKFGGVDLPIGAEQTQFVRVYLVE